MSNRKRRGFAWNIYYACIVYILFLKTYLFFSSSTKIHFYYSCLKAFNPLFYWTYGCALLQILTGLGCVIALTLFSSRTVLGPARLWQTLFISRLFFDATGHSFQWNEIVAVGRFAPKYVGIYLLLITFIYIPFYWACFTYAFRRDSILIKRLKF